MDIKIVVGLISLIAAVIAVTFQYLFTRHVEHQKHSRDLKSKAYMDYLQCVCEHAQLRPKAGSKEQKELFSKTADAKARICLYGSNGAIAAFSKFETLGASMNTPEQRGVFTHMVSVMRTDSGSPAINKPGDLQNVLLGARD